MKQLIPIIVLLLSVSIVAAEDLVIVNSEHWQDVYNAHVYAGIKGIEVKFFVNEEQARDLIASLEQSSKEVLLVQSSDQVLTNARTIIGQKGYQVRLIQGDTTELNRELAELLGITKYIVLDDAFGHNAVAIASYAIKTKQMPLFADAQNADEIEDFVQSIPGASAIVYGKIERDVSDAISGLVTESINLGNKFSNNLEIFKRHVALGTRGQIVMTNGQFLEAELFSGSDPVILVGSTNVPDEVIEVIKNGNIRIGVAVGTDIVGNARTIKDEANLKVFVKFAQGRDQIQLPLDTIEIPTVNFLIDIPRAQYDINTGILTLSFQNEEETFVVFEGEYILTSAGETIGSVADEEGVFLAGGSDIAQQYEVDLTEYASLGVIVDANVLLGEDTKALEALFQKKIKVDFGDFADDSEVIIESVSYNEQSRRFEVRVKNVGPVAAYTRVELDVFVNGNEETFSSSKLKIGSGASKKISFRAELDPEDYEDNTLVPAKAFYGEQEDALVKLFEGEFELNITQGNPLLSTNVLIGVLIAIILILFFLLLAKRDKKDKKKRKTKKSKPTKRKKRRR